MKKRMMIISAAVVAGGLAAGLGTMSITHAATTSGTSHKVGHFLAKDHVQVRLNQAERDGTITSDQKTAFKTELKSLRSEFKSAITKTSTKADRQAERSKLKSELKSWATTNNFPLAKIFPKLAS